MKLLFLFLAGLTAATFSMSSCSEDIVETEADLGKEVSSQDLSKTVNNTFAGISLENATLHSKVFYENNYRIELGDVYRTGTIEHELSAIKDYKEENATVYVLKQTIKTYDYKYGEEIDSKTSELPPLKVQKNPPQVQPLQTMQLNSSFSLLKSAAIQTLGTDCDGVDQTDSKGVVFDCLRYFKLRTQMRRVPPPSPVRARPNCMNIPNCLLEVRFIAYDIVKWRNGKSVEKVMLEAEVAPEVPDILYTHDENGWGYNPPVLSICERSLRQTSEGQKYLVAICTVLRDFYVP